MKFFVLVIWQGTQFLYLIVIIICDNNLTIKTVSYKFHWLHWNCNFSWMQYTTPIHRWSKSNFPKWPWLPFCLTGVPQKSKQISWNPFIFNSGRARNYQIQVMFQQLASKARGKAVWRRSRKSSRLKVFTYFYVQD